jgi:hypothetical protein
MMHLETIKDNKIKDVTGELGTLKSLDIPVIIVGIRQSLAP